MDDNSFYQTIHSTKAILHHSFKERGLGNDDWPRTIASHKKRDTGQLPLAHPEIYFLSDKNHCVCTFAAHFFELAHVNLLSTSIATNDDARHMKRTHEEEFLLIHPHGPSFLCSSVPPMLFLNNTSTITSFVITGALQLSGAMRTKSLKSN
jgi:hypothetical protein